MQFPKRVRRVHSTTVRLTPEEKRLLDALTTTLRRSQTQVFCLGLRCLAERHGMDTPRPDAPAVRREGPT